jgi:type I restriction enzyme S subunit
MEGLRTAPGHWLWVTLADLGAVTGGLTKNAGKAAQGNRLPYLRVANVYANQLSLDDIQHIDASDAEVVRTTLQKGDLLVVEGNGSIDHIGRVALWNGAIDPCLHQNHIIKVRFAEPEVGRFMLYWLLSPHGRREVVRAASSTSGLHTLSLSKVEKLPVCLAPLVEQQKVTAALDSYTSRLDETNILLERVQRNLKRYRASVLKAAVEGRLVPTEAELARAEKRAYEPASVLLARILTERRQRWEKEGRRGKYKVPEGLDTKGLPALPEGWCWATIDQLTAGDRSAGYGVLVPGPDVDGGVPLVRVGDVHDGVVCQDNLKRIDKAIADQFQRTYLRGGEVLISLVGTIGRTAVVPQALAGANVARAIGVLPMSNHVSEHWVEHWLRSPSVQAAMVAKAHEVARKTLNLEDVRPAPVALPPIAEQHRIVEAVADQESIIAAAKTNAKNNEARITRLRQSILKWAFEGKLVDQDPNDEPAAALLARIQAEQPAPKAAARGRKRAPA